MKTIKELCDVVRETAYAVHVYHGHGHLEKVYENALANRLGKAGIEVKQQHPLNVYVGGAASSIFSALVAFLCGRV